jgi:hypothetical protein
MKKILILLFSVCLSLGLLAQDVNMDQQVISSGGNYAVNADISLSWTLGETVIATFVNGDVVLTQGFQQPLYSFQGQVVILPAGWSGISSWVDPDDALVENIFDPVVGDMVILQNPVGQVYWPAIPINSIVNWNPHHGYIIKMNQASVLLFEGPPEGDLTVDLPNGWWIHPVLAPNNVASNALYGPLGGDLIIVKEVAGARIYWPAQGITTLNFVEPGKGYQILVTAESELDFTGLGGNPTLPLASNIELNQYENLTPWNNVIFTGASHTIAIESTAWEGIPDMTVGDYLGAFTQNGQCAGMLIYTGDGTNVALTAFGDDFTTSSMTEGFVAEEYMSFKLFRPMTGEEFTLEATFDQTLPNTDIFAIDGLSKITDFTTVATSIDDLYSLNDVEIYPNPANDRVTINCIGNISKDAMLNIYSIEEGKLVKEERLNNNTIELDISNLAQGVYFVKVTDGDYVIVKKLIKHRNTF